MRIGPLRHRITFQEIATKSAGDFGTAIESWTNVKTVYAQFKPVTASEMNEKEQTTGNVIMEFRIREPRDFTPTEKMRIVFKSRNYYITGLKPSNVGDHYIINTIHRDNE